MESLTDMLAKRPTPQEPEEVILLRAFVQKKYNHSVRITSGEFYITIAAPSAALASLLRYDEPEMKQSCKLTKKLRIRIGE
jgi:hypothetical protein